MQLYVATCKVYELRITAQARNYIALFAQA